MRENKICEISQQLFISREKSREKSQGHIRRNVTENLSVATIDNVLRIFSCEEWPFYRTLYVREIIIRGIEYPFNLEKNRNDIHVLKKSHWSMQIYVASWRTTCRNCLLRDRNERMPNQDNFQFLSLFLFDDSLPCWVVPLHAVIWITWKTSPVFK